MTDTFLLLFETSEFHHLLTFLVLILDDLLLRCRDFRWMNQIRLVYIYCIFILFFRFSFFTGRFSLHRFPSLFLSFFVSSSFLTEPRKTRPIHVITSRESFRATPQETLIRIEINSCTVCQHKKWNKYRANDAVSSIASPHTRTRTKQNMCCVRRRLLPPPLVVTNAYLSLLMLW